MITHFERLVTMTYSSSHPKEIEHFEKDANSWWDPAGPFKILHRMNPCRLEFIRDHVIRHYGREETSVTPFENLHILDVGCGGGLLTEPLARLGATVCGIDAGLKNIKMAAFHAKKSNLAINYRTATPEILAEEGLKFDVITALEIIEHVTDPARFIADCTRLLKKDGLIFFSTLNKTLKSYFLAILGAEFVLNWVPRGSHQWDKFINPAELHQIMRTEGIRSMDLKGMTYNPLTGRWLLSHDLGINYIVVGVYDPNNFE
jgi:2-polyprenyl-6-hydroxyphenyl methylase/3-demethylubiquinone-9 3-methyltransferase